MRRNAKSSCGLRHNSSQERIGNAVCVFFMQPPACWRAVPALHAGPHGAIDAGGGSRVYAFTMNSVAREPFHIYIPSP
jgi:hypothetical protein